MDRVGEYLKTGINTGLERLKKDVAYRENLLKLLEEFDSNNAVYHVSLFVQFYSRTINEPSVALNHSGSLEDALITVEEEFKRVNEVDRIPLTSDEKNFVRYNVYAYLDGNTYGINEEFWVKYTEENRIKNN